MLAGPRQIAQNFQSLTERVVGRYTGHGVRVRFRNLGQTAGQFSAFLAFPANSVIEPHAQQRWEEMPRFAEFGGQFLRPGEALARFRVSVAPGYGERIAKKQLQIHLLCAPIGAGGKCLQHFEAVPCQ